MKTYSFASVQYANAAPLSHYIPEICPAAHVIYGKPSELTEKLFNGEVQVALIPLIDYLENPELKMVAGTGICADGDVHSVLIQCRRPVGEVKIIEQDPASRTSNTLAKVVLEAHFARKVRFIDVGNAEQGDAEIMIGDRALIAPKSKYGQYDLAGIWKKMTGLPFVFAVWAHMQGESDEDKLTEIIALAKKRGKASIDELAIIYEGKLGISEEKCANYLTSSIHYDLGPRETEAIELFSQLTGNS